MLSKLYKHTKKLCPDAIITPETTYTNSGCFFIKKTVLLKYFQNDSCIRNYLDSKPDEVSGSIVLEFFKNAQDENPRGCFQIYLSWMLVLGICEICELTGLIEPTRQYRKKVKMRIASRYMFYFEQRVANDPLINQALQRTMYVREYAYVNATGKQYFMDGAFVFSNYKVFLEIQENASNHTDQVADNHKKAVVLSEGDVLVYYRIGVPYPEETNIHRTHTWFFNNILRQNLMIGLLQDSELFRISYCKNEFKIAIENQIKHCTTNEQSSYRTFLENQLKNDSKLFEAIMKYSSKQIFAEPDPSYVQSTIPCVPIFTLLEIASSGQLTPKFVKYANSIIQTIPHAYEGSTVLLSFGLSMNFLFECMDVVKLSHIKYINLYLSSIQPIYNQIINKLVDNLNVRARNIIDHTKQAYDFLEARLTKQHEVKTEKLLYNHKLTIDSYKISEVDLKNQIRRYCSTLKKHNITIDMKQSDTSYASMYVRSKEDTKPGESIIGGMDTNTIPLIRRKVSDPSAGDRDFVTDKDVLKILQNYTTKAKARELLIDIKANYSSEYVKNYLPSIYYDDMKESNTLTPESDVDGSGSGSGSESEYETDEEMDELHSYWSSKV